MKKIILSAIFSAICVVLPAAAPTLTLTSFPHPGAVATEHEIRIIEPGIAFNNATLKITDPLKKVREFKVSCDGKNPVLLKWKPEHTGYYQLELVTAEQNAKLELPVLWQRMWFYGWSVPRNPAELAKYPIMSNCCIVTDRTAKAYAKCRQYGSYSLAFAGFRSRDLHLNKSEEEIIDMLYQRWKKPLDMGADAIWIDELGSYQHAGYLDEMKILDKIFVKLRKEYPDKLIMLAVAGTPTLTLSSVCRKSKVMLFPEAYIDCATAYFGTHTFERYIDSRMETLRLTDMFFERGSERENKPETFRPYAGVMLFGLNNCYGILEEPAAARIEYFVRYMKKTAPEMPGLAFWTAGSDHAYQHYSMSWKFQDDLLRRYYVNPVLDVRRIFCSEYQPAAGKEITVSVEVHNLGGMQLYEPYTVTLYAIAPDGKRNKVSEISRPGIGVGFFTPPVSPAKDQVAVFEKDGNVYHISKTIKNPKNPPLKIVMLSRHTLNFKFRPQQAGVYKLRAEITLSGKNATILDPAVEMNLLVQ